MNFYDLNISNNQFFWNEAWNQGGGIKFELYMPSDIIDSHNDFKDNFAPYGPNIASYPMRLKIIASIFEY